MLFTTGVNSQSLGGFWTSLPLIVKGRLSGVVHFSTSILFQIVLCWCTNRLRGRCSQLEEASQSLRGVKGLALGARGNHFYQSRFTPSDKRACCQRHQLYLCVFCSCLPGFCTCCKPIFGRCQVFTWTREGVLMRPEHNSLCWLDLSSSTLVSHYFWPLPALSPAFTVFFAPYILSSSQLHVCFFSCSTNLQSPSVIHSVLRWFIFRLNLWGVFPQQNCFFLTCQLSHNVWAKSFNPQRNSKSHQKWQ